MKFFMKISLCLTLILGAIHSVYATPIYTEVSSDDYITYNNLDWAWASPVNTQHWNGFGGANELFKPEGDYDYGGWRFASPEEIDLLITDIDISLFTRGNEYINAAKYWNTIFTDITNQSNFEDGFISSSFVANTDDRKFYDTFYVRDVEVPEPSMFILMIIIALGLWHKSRKPIS